VRQQLEVALLQARALVAMLEAALQEQAGGAKEDAPAGPICPECGSEKIEEREPAHNERWRIYCRDCRRFIVDTKEGAK